VAVTIWCPAETGTALGSTNLYFNDLVVTFGMQAPRLMASSLTLETFLSARTTVLDALVTR